MSQVYSFIAVIVLWVAVSVGSWWGHRLYVHHKQRARLSLANQGWMRVREAPEVFADIRAAQVVPGPNATALAIAEDSDPATIIRERTLALLQRLQDHGDYFDDVSALRAELAERLKRDDCPPLSEILDLRRDIWASADVLLIDDPASLGEAFAEPGSYGEFCEEAARLLFAVRRPGEDDPISVRLALCREDMETFISGVQAQIEDEREREKLPSLRDLAAMPISLVRAIPRQWRALEDAFARFMDHLRQVAATVRRSQTLKQAFNELQRARTSMPGRLAEGLDRAAGLARDAGERTRQAAERARAKASDLGWHYDFLAKAHALRSRYETLLKHAPELSERGRQFIARLELQRHSEQMRLHSARLRRGARLKLVHVLGIIIGALERLRDRLTDPEPMPDGSRRLTGPMRRLFLPAPEKEQGADASYHRAEKRRRAWQWPFGARSKPDEPQTPPERKNGQAYPADDAAAPADPLPEPATQADERARDTAAGSAAHEDAAERAIERLRTVFGNGRFSSARKPGGKPEADTGTQARSEPAPEPEDLDDDAGGPASPQGKSQQILAPLLGSRAGIYDHDADEQPPRPSLRSRLSDAMERAGLFDEDEPFANPDVTEKDETPSQPRKRRKFWQRWFATDKEGSKRI